jgi:glutamate synthase domain-containing protein 1|tara:strand:+ start:3168 stop:4139 length:972 start_codon:yes stop_codon:yes gene_type:complete
VFYTITWNGGKTAAEQEQPMCGIAGIMYKKSRSRGLAPVGDQLVKMLETMVHRGHDSAGVTVAGESLKSDLLIRIWADESVPAEATISQAKETVMRAGGAIVSAETQDSYLRLAVNYEGDVPRLAEALLQTPGVVLHSIGETSEVIKDVGTPVVMDARHGISKISGTHGVGHVRMATESKIDISHAHPFWAYPFTDVTVVHNGQLTNYHGMKREYESQGHHFQTENDSELIAVYLADKLALGVDLNTALEASLDDLDGTFTYLVSTRDGMGYAKDRWSAKPLVLMETDSVVALASEEVALRSVFTEELDRTEPQEHEVMTWSA